MRGKTTLITGASRGIGLELSRVFAANGHDLVLVARSKRQLDALADELRDAHGVAVTVLQCDLAKATAARTLRAAVRKRGVQVDVLVNNAGMMFNGEFVDTPWSDHKKLLQLNIVTTTMLTHMFLDDMLSRGYGRIMNVASMAALQPLPRLASYASSKAFMLHLTEALSEELVGTGVKVTALCPGFTDTEILSEAPDVTRLPSFWIGSAKEVARDGYRACMAGTPLYISGATNQWAAQLIRYQPRWMVRAISGAMARRNR